MNSNPFSLLQSALATLYRMMNQTSNNPTIKASELIDMAEQMVRGVCDQETGDNNYYPWINTDLNPWLSDLSMFLSSGPLAMGYQNQFFRKVACPAMVAHACLKVMDNPHRKAAAMSMLDKLPACAIKTAMVKWVNDNYAVKVESNVEQGR